MNSKFYELVHEDGSDLLIKIDGNKIILSSKAIGTEMDSYISCNSLNDILRSRDSINDKMKKLSCELIKLGFRKPSGW